MRTIYRTTQFKKDVKRIKKRSKSFDVFKQVIYKLAAEELLPEKFRDHQLIGNYQGARESHIEPDWLLIYKLVEDDLTLIRTGSHADLFR